MLSGKTFKANCGVTKPIEFNCKDAGWNCEKCLELMDWCLKQTRNEIRDNEIKLFLLPETIKQQKQTEQRYKKDIAVIRKHLGFRKIVV